MKKVFLKTCFVILLFLLTFPALSQRGEIKGIVHDTTSFPRVINATAVVIGATDSVMRAFTRTRKDGSFVIPNIQYGSYILVLSHPNFGDYAEEFILNDSINLISKDFYLVQKSILINEVIIQRQRDVKINGDTTEFNAQNYKLLENASAEDLLKLLPGIKVDKDGKITAYGETVNKVYVDGEEFFGDDPTIATKNIKAEMIDKVQVYDSKTDQEKASGVDDGEKNTVINLKLKDEFKKGFFGKVYTRAGLPNSLDNGVMINSFNDKRKLTAYLTQSNIGSNSLNWKDRQNYGSGSDYTSYEDGYYYSYSANEDNILSGNEGISNSVNGGTNYTNKFRNNKISLTASYTFSSGNRLITRTTNTQQTINDSTYFKNETEDYNANLLSHKPTLRVIYDLDSNNKLTYNITGTIKTVKLKGGYSSETLNGRMLNVNNSNRSIDQTENSNSYTQSIFLTHKFKKPGRTFSILTSNNLSDNTKLKFIDTKQQYYNDGNLMNTDTLNQKNDNNLNNQVIAFETSYSEALGKKLFLTFQYKPTFANNKSSIASKIKDLSGEYNLPLDTLSNNFIFNTNRHVGGVSLRYVLKRLNIALTLNDEMGTQQRTDLINSVNNSVFKYNSINPSIQLRYTFKNKMNLNVRYNGVNNQPQINQLQPIKDYTNPLMINVGNPNLKPAYEHRMNAFIHKYSIQHSKYFYANASYSLTQNPFINQSTFSDEGVTRYFTVNGDNVSRLSLWSQAGRNIIKDLVGISFEYSLNASNNNNIINGIKNSSENLQNSGGIGLNFSKEKSV